MNEHKNKQICIKQCNKNQICHQREERKPRKRVSKMKSERANRDEAEQREWAKPDLPSEGGEQTEKDRWWKWKRRRKETRIRGRESDARREEESEVIDPRMRERDNERRQGKKNLEWEMAKEDEAKMKVRKFRKYVDKTYSWFSKEQIISLK